MVSDLAYSHFFLENVAWIIVGRFETFLILSLNSSLTSDEQGFLELEKRGCIGFYDSSLQRIAPTFLRNKDDL